MKILIAALGEEEVSEKIDTDNPVSAIDTILSVLSKTKEWDDRDIQDATDQVADRWDEFLKEKGE